jgi:hypothetical protein
MSKAFEAALACIAVPWRLMRDVGARRGLQPKAWWLGDRGRGARHPELTGREIAGLIVASMTVKDDNTEIITELVGSETLSRMRRPEYWTICQRTRLARFIKPFPPVKHAGCCAGWSSTTSPSTPAG